MRRITAANAPSAREGAVGVWTGRELVVWGGYWEETSRVYLDIGRAYDPATNGWRSADVSDAPVARIGATGQWSGRQLLVWGGFGEAGSLSSRGVFYP